MEEFYGNLKKTSTGASGKANGDRSIIHDAMAHNGLHSSSVVPGNIQ
jgi:hypothetical protein